MKYVKYLYYFILTLSLSAHTFCIPKAAVTYNVLMDTTCVNSNDYNFQSDFIDLTLDDYVEVFQQNNQSIYLRQSDIFLMSQIVYAESKGEPFEGKVAVASVILNRVLDPSFPNTIEDVIFQPYAFSCVVDGQINVDPTQECFDAVYDALSGNDPTNKALFFYNPEISTCNWMIGVEKVNSTPIGQHLFFQI